MKLFRFGMPGEEKPGIKIDEKYFNISPVFPEFDADFFANDGLTKIKEVLINQPDYFEEIDGTFRFGPPVATPSKIVCVGLNYRDHAIENMVKVPEEPILFLKAPSAYCGPDDDLILPKGSQKTDWEIELAVVIGKRASNVTEEEAMDYVAGYSMFNDVSERDFQKNRGGQFTKGKSSDTFAPLGPYLVTPDEIEDVQNLPMYLTVNGYEHQNANTNQMLFSVRYLIAYISQFMTLLPGDVIGTGTPSGVALGMRPEQHYLKPGDIIKMEIEGLGNSRRDVVAYKA